MGNAKGRTLGKQPTGVTRWRIAAYACNRTWICLLFFSSVLFRGIAPEQRWGISEMVYLCSVTTLTCALLCAGALHQRVSALLDARGGFLVGPLLCAIGVAPIALRIVADVVPTQLVIGSSGTMTGIGSALILLDLGRSYRASGTRACALETLAATAIAAAATIAVFLAPEPLSALIVFALPFAAECCIRTANSITLSQADELEPIGESIPKKLAAKFIVAALILGVMTGFMRNTYSVHSSDAFDLTYTTLFAIAAMIAVAALILVIMFSERFTIKLLYKPVILTCVIGFVIAPSLGLGTPLPFLLVTIGYTVFEIVVWVTLCDAANRFQYTFVQVFGIGRGATLAIGVVAGSLLARGLSGSFAMSHSFLVLASGLAIGAIVFSYLYVLTENDLDLYDSELYGESPQHSAATAPGKMQPAQVRTATGQGSGDAENAGTQVTVGQCRECVARRMQQDDESPNESTKSDVLAEGKPRKKPLLERCKIIGAYYGLSKREIDVFHLLSLGRSAARIQEELLISAGTVNTHTYHIYTKLDVHSQQQLIDLMQAADLDAMVKELAKREH